MSKLATFLLFIIVIELLPNISVPHLSSLGWAEVLCIAILVIGVPLLVTLWVGELFAPPTEDWAERLKGETND